MLVTRPAIEQGPSQLRWPGVGLISERGPFSELFFKPEIRRKLFGKAPYWLGVPFALNAQETQQFELHAPPDFHLIGASALYNQTAGVLFQLYDSNTDCTLSWTEMNVLDGFGFTGSFPPATPSASQMYLLPEPHKFEGASPLLVTLVNLDTSASQNLGEVVLYGVY